ncbi:MAG TPA: glycosyltransferase [Thermodesulfobacteriota bacterium]|nr:glycosyltransferase [Thermodesulfobacteriota bacterium]
MEAKYLRIALLSVHSSPLGELGTKDTGGMSVYIREMAGALAERGHSIDVFTRIHDARDPIFVELGEQARIIHLKAGPPTRLSKGEVFIALPEFIANLEKFCGDTGNRYDVVFSHYWLSGLVGKHLQQKWQVPFIMMYHTLGAVKNAVGVGEKESEVRITSEMESMRDCQLILVPTEKEKQNVLKWYQVFPEKIREAPCGVNLEQFHPVPRDTARQKAGLTDPKILLFVGRIDPLKGLAQLIKALPFLRSHKGLKLVIIGGDEHSRSETEKLKALAHQLQIQDSITFLGMIKHDQLPDFYSAADLCIMPSYYESFGLVALEALACGTPVIAADVGDLRNIIRQGETGYVVENNDPEKLGQAIDRFLSGPGKLPESIRRNRASVVSYSWDRIADTVLQALYQVCGRTGPSSFNMPGVTTREQAITCP